MPLCYVYLAQLLCLLGLLCLLLSSMPTQSPASVSTCTESICLVILPGVLPGLLPTVPSAVFMWSTYIISPMPALFVMTICLLCPPMWSALPAWLAMVCPAMPAWSPPPAWSSTHMLGLLPTCLSGHLCLILVLLYTLLCVGCVQHFMCTLMFSCAM